MNCKKKVKIFNEKRSIKKAYNFTNNVVNRNTHFLSNFQDRFNLVVSVLMWTGSQTHEIIDNSILTDSLSGISIKGAIDLPLGEGMEFVPPQVRFWDF